MLLSCNEHQKRPQARFDGCGGDGARRAQLAIVNGPKHLFLEVELAVVSLALPRRHAVARRHATTLDIHLRWRALGAVEERRQCEERPVDVGWLALSLLTLIGERIVLLIGRLCGAGDDAELGVGGVGPRAQRRRLIDGVLAGQPHLAAEAGRVTLEAHARGDAARVGHRAKERLEVGGRRAEDGPRRRAADDAAAAHWGVLNLQLVAKRRVERGDVSGRWKRGAQAEGVDGGADAQARDERDAQRAAGGGRLAHGDEAVQAAGTCHKLDHSRRRIDSPGRGGRAQHDHAAVDGVRDDLAGRQRPAVDGDGR